MSWGVLGCLGVSWGNKTDRNWRPQTKFRSWKKRNTVVFFHGYLIKIEVVGNRLFHCAHR